MVILTKQLAVSKSIEEVAAILESSAYYLAKSTCLENHFSIHCAKRYNSGRITCIPVKGTLTQDEDQVVVALHVYADIWFYLDCIIILLGVYELLSCLISVSSRWIAGIGLITLGIFMGCQFVWQGAVCLDRLAHKILH